MGNGTTIATKSVIATVVGVFGYLKGSVNELFVVLALFIICDYISGTVLALTQGKFSAKTGVYGAVKKVFYVLLVFIGFLIDLLVANVGNRLGFVITTNGAFGIAITCYLVGTEGLSILESLALMGLPVPDFMKKALGIILDKSKNLSGLEDENKKN
ncbi:MAG: phage holin family protein [Bacillota bacterium]|nr:phage holin family protein [Bacillota bacterium]